VKRAIFILAVLFLVCSSLMADDRKNGVDPTNANLDKPLVVNPVDFKKPNTDPDKELSYKYAGKTVRFTGVVHKWGQDADTKATWLELRTEFTDTLPSRKATNQVATPKETLDVKVYFPNVTKALRAKKGTLTVQGTADINPSDGALSIREATIVGADGLFKR
jgi:hypothetical protein